MKRICAIGMAVILTVLCLISFTSCGKEDDEKFARGIRDTEVGTYTNETLGFKFTMPSTWVFYTDEQMAQMTQITEDMFKNPEVFDNVDVTTLFEFMAVQMVTGNNIVMSVEKVASSVSLNNYVLKTKNQLNSELIGAKVIPQEKITEVTIGNSTWSCITAQTEYSGVIMQQYIYIRKIGNAMASITVTDVTENNPAFFLAMFSAVETDTQ